MATASVVQSLLVPHSLVFELGLKPKENQKERMSLAILSAGASEQAMDLLVQEWALESVPLWWVVALAPMLGLALELEKVLLVQESVQGLVHQWVVG